MSGSGISWAICKSAPRPRQITMPASHHSFLQAGCPSCRPTNSVKALKETVDELKERLITVSSDFRQGILDTPIDQWRKRLQASVQIVDILNMFYEQTLASNLHFSRVFGSNVFCLVYSSCQIFYCGLPCLSAKPM